MVEPRIHRIRNVTISVPLIRSGARAPTPFRDNKPQDSWAMTANTMFLFDPDRPLKDPNELLAETGGRMLDREAMNHNCPLCKETMSWPLFSAHVRKCLERHYHLLPIEHRVFTGATPAER